MTAHFITLDGIDGAGKTTLLRLALGLIHPTAGTVRRTVSNVISGSLSTHRFAIPN